MTVQGTIETISVSATQIHSVKLRALPKELYFVHNNRVKDLSLQEGDEIKFETTKSGPYGKEKEASWMLKLEKVEKAQ